MNCVKILWIASSVPCKEISHAGGKTFRFYFDKFKENPEFDIRLIGFSDQLERRIIENRLHDVNHFVIYKDKFNLKKLCNLASTNNPFHKYAGMISNYYAFKTLEYVKTYKYQGYEPDVIILEWTNIVLLIDEIKKIYPNAYYIASEHDVSFIGAERQAQFYTGFKKLLKVIGYKTLKRREIESLRKCDLILPHNKDNIELLQKEGISREKCQWLIPFYYDMRSVERKSNNRDILFYGAMSRKENYLSAEWFINHVMPLLNEQDIRFVILGGNPPEFLKKMECDRIHVTGFVEDIESYFSNAMCLVAPLVLGAGIKVKILEALSAGIPVLTNNIGIEGIPAINGNEYIHCETPEEYKNAIIDIKQRNIDLSILEKNARNFVDRYSPDKSADMYIKRVRTIGESLYGTPTRHTEYR